MFGQNPVAKVRTERTLLVHSIFYTIQGEGPLTGMPAVFVRLAGCNLRCFFCDTDFTSKSTEMTAEAVADAVREAVKDYWGDELLVVLTGGEPFLQAGVVDLLDALPWGARMQVETAGTVWPAGLEESVRFSSDCIIVCSPKTPHVHPLIEEHCDYYKYIVRAGEVSVEDGLPCYSTQLRGAEQTLDKSLFRPTKEGVEVSVQPCHEEDPAATHANTQLAIEIAKRHGYRLSTQVHRIIGVE